MSWTSYLANEAMRDGPWINLKRYKTKRKIKASYEPQDPAFGNPHMVSRAKLEIGEILEDDNGTKVRVVDFPMGSNQWTNNVYEIKILK